MLDIHTRALAQSAYPSPLWLQAEGFAMIFRAEDLFFPTWLDRGQMGAAMTLRGVTCAAARKPKRTLPIAGNRLPVSSDVGT
jgi:hypothetical protein